MSLRARIFIIVSILVLFILGISIFLVINKNKSASPAKDDQTVAAPSGGAFVPAQLSVATPIPEGLPAKTATPLEAEQNGVQQLAKVLVERYGTYSSDNNFQNIKDVQALTTKLLWTKFSSQMKAGSAGAFVGMTTKVIGTDLTDWSGTKAVVVLTTVRTEEKNGKITTNYQNASVGMVKQDGVWLANSFTWD